MKDDRLRVQMDAQYAEALGRAAFTFARLEWAAAWCLEQMQPGYINTIEPKKKTAGVIGSDLQAAFANHPNAAVQAGGLAPAIEFCRLVKTRNAILHGKPGTAKNGDQTLYKGGAQLDLLAIERAADEFVAAELPLLDLLYGALGLKWSAPNP